MILCGIASLLDFWHPQLYNKHPQSRASVPFRHLRFASNVPGLGDISSMLSTF